MYGVDKNSNNRTNLIYVLILFWMAAIGVKLVYLQVHQHENLSKRAEGQQEFDVKLSPVRGSIYDRNGNPLAQSTRVKSLYAAPTQIGDPAVAADKLAKLLHIDRDELYERFTSRSRAAVVVVKRKLSDDEAARVEAASLPGLHFIGESKRVYAGNSTASHILGFVDVDENGKGGIEVAYDKQIRGKEGHISLEVDALRNPYNHVIEESVPGADIKLTIDLVIQREVERALAAAVKANGAIGGTIVVVRPATGEILALANYPYFDPNQVGKSNDNQRANRAVEFAFEPGSIFKLVPYAAALEENIIQPTTMINCGGGEIRLPGRIIHDGNYGILSASQALAKSSNGAAIKVGQWLGNERLARYIEAFGFGKSTGIELPGESRGIFRPASKWDASSIGSIPMGHEIGVTALQAVAAFAAIANGGEWVQPYIVSDVTSPTGEVIEKRQIEKRRVVSEATAEQLKSMLEDVVAKGTGKKAQVLGYRAAGKTGTAQKFDTKLKRYSKVLHVASFAGFAPVENPEIACIVSIDEPRGSHLGGDVAAPVFAHVVGETLSLLGVPPEGYTEDEFIAEKGDTAVPPNIIVENNKNDDEDKNQPAIDAVELSNRAEVASKANSGANASIVVPNLKGLSVREAVALCSARGIKIKAGGDGLVASQSPPPGTMVTDNTICIVRLSKQIGRQKSLALLNER
jgi:cell division protein FtsI/penicillin-binding protein 2